MYHLVLFSSPAPASGRKMAWGAVARSPDHLGSTVQKVSVPLHAGAQASAPCDGVVLRRLSDRNPATLPLVTGTGPKAAEWSGSFRRKWSWARTQLREALRLL